MHHKQSKVQNNYIKHLGDTPSPQEYSFSLHHRDHKVQNNYNPASHTCTNKIQSPKRNYVSQQMSIATGTVHVSWRLTTTMQTTKNGSIITGLYLHNMHEKNKDLFQQILHMPISEQLINLFANIVILVTLQWHIYEKSTTYYHSSLAGARITFRFKLWSHSHNSFSLTFAIEIKANRFKLLSHSPNSFSLTFAIEIKANRFKLLSHSHNSFSLTFAIETKVYLDRRGATQSHRVFGASFSSVGVYQICGHQD